MDEKQLQFLFDNYGKSKGFVDFNEFKSLMQNEGSRKVFFDDSNKDLGFKDYNDFEATIGVKKNGGGNDAPPPTPLGIASPSVPQSQSKSWESSPLNPASGNFTQKPEDKKVDTSGRIIFDLNDKGQIVMPTKKADNIEAHKEAVKNNPDNRGGYIGNKLLRGIGELITGASDNVMNLMTSVLPESVIGGTKEEAMKQWREEVSPISREFFEKNLGDKTVTEKQKDKYDNELITSSIGSLAQTLPAILSPKGAKAIALISQAEDAALQSINSTEQGKALPESTKSVFISGVGVAHGLIDKFGLDKIFGKQSSALSRKIAGKVFADLLKTADSPITKEMFDEALEVYTKSAKQQLLNAVKKLGTAGAVEFVTGTLQEGSTIFAEILLNKGVGKDIFEPTSWGKAIGRSAKAGLQEAIGGFVLGGVTVPFSKVDNYISDKVSQAKSSEDIDVLKVELEQEMDRLGAFDEDSKNEVRKLIDDYTRVNSKIPDSVPNRKFAADKIIERENIEQEIESKIAEKDLVDVAFQPEIQTEIDLLSKKVEDINNELVNPNTVTEDGIPNTTTQEPAPTVDKPIIEATTTAKEQGGEAAVQQSTEPTGQGTTKTTDAVLEEGKVEQLRAAEQAEYDAMPNPNDKGARQEIYDKYDKLITPLLEKQKSETPPASKEYVVKKTDDYVKDKTDNISLAKEILNDLGVDATFTGFSDTNGVSVYFEDANGQKIRVSDHDITNKDRVKDEISLRFDNKRYGGGVYSKFEQNKKAVESLLSNQQVNEPTPTEITANSKHRGVINGKEATISVSNIITEGKYKGNANVNVTYNDGSGGFGGNMTVADIQRAKSLLSKEQSLKTEVKPIVQESKEVGKKIVPALEKKPTSTNATNSSIAKEIYREVNKMDAGTSAEEIALQYIAGGGTVGGNAINEVVGTVKRASLNTGRKEKNTREVSARDYYKPNDETLDEIAHKLWADGAIEDVTTMDIKNALMNVIRSYNTRLDAAKAYLAEYSPEYIEKQRQEEFYQQYKEEVEAEERAILEMLEKENTDIEEAMADEDYVTKLIEKYEAENEGQNQQSESETETTVSEGTRNKKSASKKEESEKGKVDTKKEGKYEAKAKAIAEKIMAAKVVPDWLKIDDENVSTKGSSAEDLKKVLADAVINMGKLLDKGVEFSQAVRESVKGMIDIHGEVKRKEIEAGFEKYYRENEADAPPPKKPPVETANTEGEGELSEKGIMNRLNKAKNVSDESKKGYQEAGLKYVVASREEAQSVAKSIIDEFGIDQAVLFADANKFKGGVSSAIYAESLNRLYEQEQNAKTPKEKADIAAKFAEISIQYDETSREKGRDISYIDFFYKKSPLGIEMAENARRKKDFDKWSKNKEQSWKEVLEEMRKDTEFEEAFNEEVRERMKKERAESRKARIEKVDKIFDDAIDKFKSSGATYSTLIPPPVITAALKGLKKAYHAGENIAEAVQQAIDYISTELKGANWDKEKFRKEWEEKLADGTSKKKLTDEELKAKVLDRFRKKLKGLTESQKDEVIRQSYKTIIENGGLEFDEFKKIIARVTGRDEMTPEQSAKLKELVKDLNSVDEAGKKARETRTSQSLKDYRNAEKKAGAAQRELSILLNSKPEILKRLTSIMQLNTLGFVALVNNPAYNIVNQLGIRLPVGVVKSGIDLGINKAGKLFGKDYKRETDVFSVGVQREFFKKLGLGGREAVGQFLTGLNRMDYIQKEVNSQQIRPITAILELKEKLQGKRNLTKAQVVDKLLEATAGVPAEIVARTLNLGDKPMRFAADAGQSAAFAKALGLKGIDYDMFIQFPREEAYRRYKEQGLSDAEAGKKADYIKDTIIKEGERSTFQQDNILNDVLSKIFGGDKSGSGALAKSVVVSPYIKIPSNAYWSYFNIVNPEVAFLQGLLYAGKAAAKQKGIYKRGLFDKENTSAAKDLNEAKYWIAHGVVGMATKAVIGSLVAAGIFRSSNDEDDTKKEREGEAYYEPQGTINMDKLWTYMKGEDPNKIKGGFTIQNRWFGHWGSVGNSIAKREEDMTPEQREKQQDLLAEVFDRMSASFLPELEQGIFGNSSSLVKAMASNDWKQWGVNTMNMFTNIVHPATAAQLSKAQLPYYSKVKSDSFMKELKNSMLNRSSTLRRLTNEYPPSKIGIWGDVVDKKDNVLMRMFGISNTNDDNFAQPIYEDYKRTNNTKFFPSAVKPEVSSNGVRVKLPPEKALELERYIGQQRKKLLAPYVNNMAFFEDSEGNQVYYKDLKKDKEKIKKLDIIYDMGFERGKELFLQKPENKIYEIKEKTDDEKKQDEKTEESNLKFKEQLSEIK